uniref:Putative ribonuclease H-like domain-containing protein n=1 Tax=Tanacetum cinerariifolium TaxID=118510 RepID=A0A6L2J5F1_TANCI|nr:putative ribonuclease H-like domain-containing protein [Tanacetum cinerariifolium]
MIATTGEPYLHVPVPESFHEQTDEELTENDIKWMDADDQAIQTILLGLLEVVYATVDSCETAKEIWERVRQMMKATNIGEQEKKAKLFNEWEKFTSNDGESIESYYHRFMQLMNDLKRNKHFLENIAENFKIDKLKMLEEMNAGVQNGGNQNRLVVVPGIANQNGIGNVVAARAEGDLDEIEEVNANCILMVNLQHASTSGTQLDKAPVYDTNGSAEVQLNDNCYDNKIFNMFTQEEQYTDLLESIFEPQLVLQNDNHATSISSIMMLSGGTIETSSTPNEETHAHQETVYHNLVAQKSIYQEQCLTRKINALHLSSAKQIMTLNDEISNLNKQLSKEKSSISSLMEEKKRLKHDFKTREEKFLDKEVDLEAKIKDLENILLKRDQTVQTMHMLNPKPNSFSHPDQKKVLGYPNPSYLKKAQLKQQSLYNAKFVRDFKSLAKEADESLDKQKSLELKIKRLLKASVIHDIMSIMQNGFVDVPSDLQTELDQCKYDKISYDKAYNDMQQKVEWFQAQLRDLNGKSSDTPSALNTLDPLNQKLESKIVELEFQVKFLGIVRFGNEHIAAILGYGDLKWGNITITRVYFVKGLGHNLFSVGQFCDANLEVAFRMNTCFIRDLDGVELLKGNHSINLYTINLYDMASASPICLMARATPTKLWLWHQRLSYLNFDTINDLAKNDLISGLPKFKYAKEHLCPSCEQGKSKRTSHPPKPISNSKQRLHLLHMDLCGRMRVASINGKRYVLVIVDDYSRYTWVHFLKTKDELPEVIKNFLKKIFVRLQAPVIIVCTDNGTKFKNHVLKEYFNNVGITHEASSKNP